MRDLHSHIKAVRAISPVSVADNTAQVSQIIDRQGFNSLEFLVLTGSLADADATFAVTVEESDAANMTGATAVDPIDLLVAQGGVNFSGFLFSDDDTVRKLGYVGNCRYVRLTITPSGNASAALLAAVAVLGHPDQAPVA